MKYKLIVSLTICTLFLISSITMSQDLDLIFSHKFHAEEVGAGCTDCHAAADTSTKSTQNLLPDMQSCYNCHDEETACTLCHKDPDNASAYPRITSYIAKFPHALHISNNIKCSKCHADVEKSSNIMDRHLPPMATCVDCHSDLQQIDYCITCHSAGEDLKPLNHRLDWKKAHGIVSYNQENECSMCHDKNQCLNCHQKDNLNHIVHPLNFRNNHALYARGNKDNCYTCHEDLAFCVDCHQAEFVLPRTHANAGWANPNTGGKHAREALLDLDSCLSCHSESNTEPICADCHVKE